jgi:hypothetical protein
MFTQAINSIKSPYRKKELRKERHPSLIPCEGD